MRLALLPLLAVATAACAATPANVAPAAAKPTVQVSPAASAEQVGLVDVSTLAPDIRVEMRYAGSDNFTGAVVPGFGNR